MRRARSPGKAETGLRHGLWQLGDVSTTTAGLQVGLCSEVGPPPENKMYCEQC